MNIARQHDSGSRGTLRARGRRSQLTSAKKPAFRARIASVASSWSVQRRRRRSCGLGLLGRSASRSMRLPVSSRNTSSSVGVRSVSSRTRTPHPLSATATGLIAAGAVRRWRSISSSPCDFDALTPSTPATARRATSASPSTRAMMTSAPIARLSSSGVPSATDAPALMMPTRSASSSASSRYCVVRKIVMPSSSLRRRTSSHTVPG